MFLEIEIIDAISKYKNTLTPGPDHLLWSHIKILVVDSRCFKNIVNITNVYIAHHYWPTHFKKSTSIIILKPNKISYNTFKLFYLIVLLNILDKLIKKLISKRLQFQAISLGFLHSNQVGGLGQRCFNKKNLVLGLTQENLIENSV